MHLRRKGNLRVTWEALIRAWLEWSFLTLDKHELEKGLPHWIRMVQVLDSLQRSIHPYWSLFKL
jgi:hypothetical protein